MLIRALKTLLKMKMMKTPSLTSFRPPRNTKMHSFLLNFLLLKLLSVWLNSFSFQLLLTLFTETLSLIKIALKLNWKALNFSPDKSTLTRTVINKLFKSFKTKSHLLEKSRLKKSPTNSFYLSNSEFTLITTSQMIYKTYSNKKSMNSETMSLFSTFLLTLFRSSISKDCFNSAYSFINYSANSRESKSHLISATECLTLSSLTLINLCNQKKKKKTPNNSRLLTKNFHRKKILIYNITNYIFYKMNKKKFFHFFRVKFLFKKIYF
jgi:hypothetical protein